MAVNDPHTWCIEHFPAHLASLLDPSDEQRIRTHLATCEPCRGAAEHFQIAIDQRIERPDGHIPAAVLGRWHRYSAELRGLERALVRQHLEQCEDCRDDLDVLGYEPVLALVPELELGFDLPPATETAPEAPATSARPARQPRARATSAADRARSWFGDDSLRAIFAPALMLRVTRGDSSVNALEIDAETRAVALRVPLPLEIAPNAIVQVEVRSPESEILMRERCRVKDLAPPRLLILANRGQPLVPGAYRMRIASEEPGEFSPIEVLFDLKATS